MQAPGSSASPLNSTSCLICMTQHFYYVLPLNRKPQGSHSQMGTRHDLKSLCNFQVPLTVLSGFPFQLYLFALSHLLSHAVHLAFRWLCIWRLPHFPSTGMAREGYADYSFRHLLRKKKKSFQKTTPHGKLAFEKESSRLPYPVLQLGCRRWLNKWKSSFFKNSLGDKKHRHYYSQFIK